MTVIMPGLFAFDLFQVVGAPLVYAHNHRLSGSIKISGDPAPNKRVIAIAAGGTSPRLAGVTHSDINGEWEITGIAEELDGVGVMVIATDEAGIYNAKIADNRLTEGIGETK